VAESSVSVALEGISHRFGSRSVLVDISLIVCAGQVGVVMGANGSGKSTLLKIAAGLLRPESGKVAFTLESKPVEPMLHRRCIGYVSPDLRLYHELTGVENLEFFGRLRGLRLNNDGLRDILDRVGLLGRGRELVGNYSSGMRQRLKYAYALLGSPPILLLDEPTANLDTEGVAMVERVIAGQRSRSGGGLAIIATNEPREEAWGDMSVRLNGSK